MANIKSQIKRVKTNSKRRLANVHKKSTLKTAIKKVLTCVQNAQLEEAKLSLTKAFSKLDAAVTSGIHHRNYANRQKSRLAKAVNSITA